MKFSLRTKLTILIESLVVIIVLLMGVLTTMRAKETLESELYKRGLSRANELAKFAVNPLLRQDLPMLRRFVNHSSEHEYVLYVMILDNHGRVVMHSDLSDVGKTYKDKANFITTNTRKSGFTPLYLTKQKELYCDISTPIQVADVLLGSVWLGYSYAAIEKEIARAQKQIFLIGLATISIGMVVAYFLAAFISSPIKKITYAVEQVAGGHFDAPLSINRNDEIGALAHAFNRMTEDLRSTTVSKDYVDSIIGSMKDTLIVVDLDANIRTVNKATCDLLGYKEEELIGKNIHFVVLQKSVSTGAEELGGMLNRNQEIEEIVYLTKTGKQIPMLFSAAALKNKDKKIVAFVIIARDVTERKQAEDALRQSEKQLHFLSSQLLIAQEKERKRLSIELHDELGQSLMVLKLWLRSMQGSLREDQPELKRDCDEMTGYINEISENVRRLSRDLSPSILVDLGLSAAIRSLVTYFTKRCDIENSLDIMELDTKFSKEGQITLYRIVQECLTNIAKHAQATHVSVVIKEQDGHVYFCVEDNGKGFDVKKCLSKNAPAKGIGLAAMFEQVRMLGGSLDIWSQEAAGTKITFTLPLNVRG
jgi:PAS domain S-box-containing protein